MQGQLHETGIETEKPTAQPIIGDVVHEVEERRRGDHQVNAAVSDLRDMVARFREQLRLPGLAAQPEPQIGRAHV